MIFVRITQQWFRKLWKTTTETEHTDHILDGGFETGTNKVKKILQCPPIKDDGGQKAVLISIKLI